MPSVWTWSGHTLGKRLPPREIAPDYGEFPLHCLRLGTVEGRFRAAICAWRLVQPTGSSPADERRPRQLLPVFLQQRES